MKLGILAGLALMSLSLLRAEPSQPIRQGQRVFTIGHSFHVWVAPMIKEMADAAGIKGHEIAGISSIGGSTIIMHWNLPDTANPAKTALIGGKVDVLTMSNIWLPDEGIEKFVRLANEHNPKIRITIQEFWLPNDHYRPVYPLEFGSNGIKVNHNATDLVKLRQQDGLYIRDMEAMIRDMNQKIGRQIMFAVPVNQAVLALREKVRDGHAPGIKDQASLFVDDWGHPTNCIQVLAAYCHFAVIYRTCPIGLPVPTELALIGLPADTTKALNLLLQQLAWNAVIQDPLSGVTAPAK